MSVFLTVRVEQEKMNEFKQYCSEKLKRHHAQVVRELMTAVVEDRLKITTSDEMKELYNVD